MRGPRNEKVDERRIKITSVITLCGNLNFNYSTLYILINKHISTVDSFQISSKPFPSKKISTTDKICMRR